jgi:hypothetical protein
MSNGLGSFMQGAAPLASPQNAASQGPQPRQGMPMPPANDPRMAAAMDVVEADIPESLKQLVSEKEFADKAKELLMSAGGQAAMNQTPPKPPTVAERVEKQAEEGVAGLLARLSPGIQQRGQQMAMAQRRPPMQGQRPPMPQQGVSGMPANNMMRAAQGGIVGYAEGDLVKKEKLTPMQYGQQKFNHRMFQKELNDYSMLKGLETKYKEENNNEGLENIRLDLEKYKGGRAEEQYMIQRRSDMDELYRAKVKGMARGGVVGYAGPDGSQVGSVGGRKVIDSSSLTDRQKNSTPAFGMTPTASPMLIGGILKGLGFGPKYDFGGRRNEEFALESARRNAAPIPIGNASQPIPMLMEKYGAERVTAFIAEQKALKAKGKALTEAYGNSRAEAEAAGGLMQVEDLELMEEIFAEKYRDILNDSMGMARGGIVGYAPGGDVESKGQMGSGRGELNRARREESAEAMRNSPEWKRQQRIKEIRYETGADLAGAIAQYEAELAAGAPPNVQVERTQPAGTQFQTDTRSPQLRAFPQRPSSLIDDSPVGIATGGVGSPQSNIDETLRSIAALTVPETEIGDLARSPLRDPIEGAALKNIKLDASALSNTARKAEQGLASQAYAMSPEMKAAYARQQQERDAYYTAQLDPKRLKDQKINALLAGLASDGGIAKSGIAALQGVTGVGTAAAELGRKQSEERFGSAKEREGINREGKIKGYEAGSRMAQAVYERTSATVNQASQSLSQLATSDETRGQAAAVQEYTRQMDGLKLQLNVFLQQEKISQDDRRNLQRIVADMRNAQSDIDNTITKLRSDMLLMEDPEKTAATALIQTANVQRGLIQQEIDTTLTSLGIDVAAKPSGGGGERAALPAGFVPD